MVRDENMPRQVAAILISALLVLEGATFLLFGLLHLGLDLPIGFSEPRIIPAFIVESLCGLFLLAAAYAVTAQKAKRWLLAVSAHVCAILGVLLGMTALALGAGPRTPTNELYHRVILVVLILGPVFFFTPWARTQQQRHPA
jgi:hypothetical protein